MTKLSKLKQVAEDLPQHLSCCGTVIVFAHHLVRPGDLLYQVVEATADLGHLRVRLSLALTGREEWIEVFELTDVKLSSGSLHVGEARMVRAFGTEWTRPPGETGAALVLEN